MKQYNIVILLTIIITLAGCQTTGGTLGGLFPGPKFLDGEINNNIYTSKDKKFSIQVPHIQDSYEYKYMEIKEQFSNVGAYISFGPAAFDKSIYRLETANRLTPESQAIKLETVVPQVISGYAAQLEKAYGTKIELQSKDKTTVNGHEAFHLVFTQAIPAGKHINNQSTIFNHEIYVIDLNTIAGIIWVQTPTEHNTSPHGTALTPLEFATSLKVNAQQVTAVDQ